MMKSTMTMMLNTTMMLCILISTAQAVKESLQRSDFKEVLIDGHFKKEKLTRSLMRGRYFFIAKKLGMEQTFKFYYGKLKDETNKKIEFDAGKGELTISQLHFYLQEDAPESKKKRKIMTNKQFQDGTSYLKLGVTEGNGDDPKKMWIFEFPFKTGTTQCTNLLFTLANLHAKVNLLQPEVRARSSGTGRETMARMEEERIKASARSDSESVRKPTVRSKAASRSTFDIMMDAKEGIFKLGCGDFKSARRFEQKYNYLAQQQREMESKGDLGQSRQTPKPRGTVNHGRNFLNAMNDEGGCGLGC